MKAETDALVRSLIYAVEYLLFYGEGHETVRRLLDEVRAQLSIAGRADPPTK